VPMSDSDALHARVRAFVRASLQDAPSEPFDPLALAIARFQAANVPPFARLVRARGVDLERARAASAIPAVPADVFRLARVAAHPPERDAVVFRTSGTTAGAEQRGEHPLRTTETYALAALSWGERFLWPDGPALGVIVLAAPLASQPDSSLGFMLDRFARALEGPASFHLHVEEGEARLDVDGLASAAADARAAARPAIVLATSFALVHLLDQRGDRDLRLPPGSRVMQTGGFKGRSREVPPDELRALVAEAFGVQPARVVSEYGMTELGSQLYEGTLAAALRGVVEARPGVYHAPPWMRVTAVDPVSLAPLPAGAIGVARFVDLANVDSAVVIQTADRVRLLDEGEGDGGGRVVELLGRLPGAPPRGCSIAVDEMLGGA
jgi:Acyl-protein synthetase, LuxE